MKDSNVNYEMYNKLYSGDVLYYNKLNNAHERYQMYLQKKLHKYINPEALNNVLDIGSGAGVKTYLVAKDFPHSQVLGIDFAEEGIKCANSFFEKQDNLSFEVGDAKRSGYESYDMIMAFEIAEHIDDYHQFFKEISLNTKRYIMLSTPIGRMRKYEDKVGHLRNFQKREIEEIFHCNGFKPVKIFYAGFPFWSPISRDLLNITFDNRDHTSSKKTNKLFHDVLFFLYKYFCFLHHGDQFIGLFEKE